MAKKKKVQQPKVMNRNQLTRHQKAQRRQRIVFFSGVGIIAAVLIIILVGVIVGVVIPNQKTVLKVNDREFNYKYYEEALKLFVELSPGTQPSTLNSQLLPALKQNEIVTQAASVMGITVSDADVKARIDELGIKKSNVATDIVRAEMLKEKLREEHFSAHVALTAPQVKMNAMLVESEEKGVELRPRIVVGEDFQSLATDYGLNYYSYNQYFGEFDWHPEEIYYNLLSSQVPIDFAFSAEPDTISWPLPDEEASKKLGYWVIRVNAWNFEPGNEDEGVPAIITADVTALLLGSEAEAAAIKQRLENGEDIAALAEEFSQHSASKENGGEMGVLTSPLTEGSYAVSEAFDAFIFSDEFETGTWSEPVKDTNFWTDGGAWMVFVIDRDDNRVLSEDDRTSLIQSAYYEWLNTVTSDTETYIVEEMLTPEQQSAALAAVS